MRFIDFDSARFFEQMLQLISNFNQMHFGSTFVVEFTISPVFTLPGKEELNLVLWAKIRYQICLGDHTEISNMIDARVVGLLH